MRNKKEILTSWHATSNRVNALKAELRAAEGDLHIILRELHGVPIGTRWRLRIERRHSKDSFEAVLDDIKSVSYYGRPEYKPWATAFRIKKDGTLEDRARSVYTDWEVIGTYKEKAR